MKALRLHNFGPPSVLKIEELPEPTVAEGELLVRVKAAAINPSDFKNVAGFFSQTTLPRTPGRDFSGIVISKGEYEGQEVWGTGPGLGLTRDGAHAEIIAVPAEFVTRKPKQLTFQEAAALGVPYTTAWAALIDAAQMRAGETVLIVGAAGAVGTAAIQIANWKQARVIGADRSAHPIPGTKAVVATSEGDLREQVLEVNGGTGVDVVFDMVGGSTFEPVLNSLRTGGRYVVISSPGTSRVSFDLVEFYHNRGHIIGVDSNKFEASELKRMMQELTGGFEAGALHAPSVESAPFEHAIASYEKVAKGSTGNKQILTF